MSNNDPNYSLKLEIDETARITYTQRDGPFDWDVTRVFEGTFRTPQYEGAKINLLYENNQITYTISNIPLGHDGPLLPSFASIDEKLKTINMDEKPSEEIGKPINLENHL